MLPFPVQRLEAVIVIVYVVSVVVGSDGGAGRGGDRRGARY